MANKINAYAVMGSFAYAFEKEIEPEFRSGEISDELRELILGQNLRINPNGEKLVDGTAACYIQAVSLLKRVLTVPKTTKGFIENSLAEVNERIRELDEKLFCNGAYRKNRGVTIH